MKKDEAKKELDLESKKVLKCLDEHGESNITEIKTRIGEKKYVVAYRLEKLEDLGLIRVELHDRKNNVGKIRWAHLSENGRTLIQKGLLLDLEKEKEKKKPMFDENKVENLESRCDNIEMRLNTVIDDLSKMNDIEGNIEEIKNLQKELEEMEEDFNELREWMSEWTDTQEKYLEALKLMMEEKFEEDLEDYL